MKAASGINEKDSLTPQEKMKAIRVANIEIKDAVEAYTKGKEKVRWADDGNARFANSLDALAVASKYAPGMKVHVNKTIQRINKVRGAEPGEATHIDPEKFGENYGAERAKFANEKAMAEKAAEKAPAKAAPSV